MEYKLFTDGGARGNPGPAGIGYIIFCNDKLIAFDGKYIGETTNNQAEYKALLAGLILAKKLKINNLVCHLDSELVVKQIKGEYKVKNEGIIPIFKELYTIIPEFEKISFLHIPRKENAHADKLVNLVLDARN